MMVDERRPFELETVEIDHPAHPDWLADGLKLMPTANPQEFEALRNSPEYHAVKERYSGSEDQLRYLIQNIGSISMHVDSKRATHELANYHLLRVAASGLLSPSALDTYYDLRGRPEKAGAYIAWFAKVVTAAYTNFYRLKDAHDDTHGEGERHAEECRNYEEFVNSAGGESSFNKISLDLGGKRQSGDWNRTVALDRWAESLATQIHGAVPDAEFKLARTPTEQIRGYKLYPWQTKDMNGVSDPFNVSATIRRRRREALVRIPGFREIVVIKESKGWLLPYNIEDDVEKELIVRALANWNNAEHGPENSAVAKIAGKVFERAILKRETTLEVIPTHAHYYMQASPDLHMVPLAA